ncbi:hypothetical protein J2W15_002509 [Pseudarthrobacter sulfonivorans]|nr:hypothetical protein [Pseudarthrobacter sulfonivorans]MDP9999006.1 hypothetical protein [Pseudarthrobacter sulfonivorans]
MPADLAGRHTATPGQDVAAAGRLGCCSEFPACKADQAQSHQWSAAGEDHADRTGCQSCEGLGLGKESYRYGQDGGSQRLSYNQSNYDFAPSPGPGFRLVPGKQHERNRRDGGQHDEREGAKDHRAHQDEGKDPDDADRHQSHNDGTRSAAHIPRRQRDEVPCPPCSFWCALEAEQPHKHQIRIGANGFEQRGRSQVACACQLADQIDSCPYQRNGGRSAEQRTSDPSGLLANQAGQDLKDYHDDERRHHDNDPPAREASDREPLGVVDIGHGEGSSDKGPQPRRHVLENVGEERRDGTQCVVVRL